MADKITSFNDMQKEFIKWMLPRKRAILISPVGAGKCVKGSTLVRTDSGIREISSLTNSWTVGWQVPSSPISVYTPEGLSSVTALYHEKDKPCLEITFADGSSLTCSAEHHLETDLGNIVSVGSLSVGDYVTRTVLPSCEGTKVSPNLAYCVGLFLGDGCRYQGKKSAGWSYVSTEKDLVSFFRDTVMPSVPIGTCAPVKPGYLPQYQVQDLGSRIVPKFKYLFPYHSISYNKRIPKECFGWSIEARSAVLNGLLDTDGSVSSCKTYLDFCFTNKDLCLDIQRLGYSLGLYSVVEFKSLSPYTQAEIWRVRVFSNPATSIHEILNLYPRGKKRRQLKSCLDFRQQRGRVSKIHLSLDWQKCHCPSSGEWRDKLRKGDTKYGPLYLSRQSVQVPYLLGKVSTQIVEIKSVICDVYDLEVDSSDHLYFLDSFLTHNSLCLTGLQALMSQRYGIKCKMLVFTETKAMGAFHKANFKNLSVTQLVSQNDLLQFYPSNPMSSDIYLFSLNLLPKLMRASTQVKQCFFKFLETVNLIITDEIHVLRVYKTTRAQAYKKVLDWLQPRVDKDPYKKIVAITATPVHKSIENWHTIMSYVEPRLLGTYWNFLDSYCITNQRSARVGQKMYTRNGTHKAGKTIQFNEIVGFKNLDTLYSKLDPYLFQWGQTIFSFTFKPEYYSLSPTEQDTYRQAIKGKGLDKDYHITLLSSKTNTSHSIFRDKTDQLKLVGNRDIFVKDLVPGTSIIFDGVIQYVQEVLSREKDAQHTVRMIAAQKSVSTAEQKLSILADYIDSQEYGCLVYCNYKDSVEAVRQYLLSRGCKRRLVVITGDTQNIKSVVSNLTYYDVAIITRVAQQSLDFYFPRMVLFEIAGLSPGSLEQLCGRLSRYNSPFKDLEVLCLLREGSIENYFYERLRYFVRSSKTNIYTKDFPPSTFMERFTDEQVTVQLLKEELLWKV